jgi:hypothetical protein
MLREVHQQFRSQGRTWLVTGPRMRAVYNSRIAQMCSSWPGQSGRFACLVLAVLVLISSLARASDSDTAAQELARKISATCGPAPVSLEMVNRSDLGKKSVDQINLGIRAQLGALGVHVVTAEQATAAVKITISENLRNYVWVAEIRQGSEVSTAIVTAPRAEGAFQRDTSPAFTIRRVPLWAQEERILDVAVLEEQAAPTLIAVLDPEKIVFYRFADNHWRQEQALAILHTRIWPRDMRGRLIPRQDHLLDIYLPGVFCQTPNSAPLSLVCRDSDDPWPLSGQFPLGAFFAPTRNFFTGVLSPGVGKQTSTVKFYSAVPLPRPTYTLWLLAGVDGNLHLLDGVSEQTANLGWGSDLAAIKTSCGSGWQVLATRAGDDSADAIRAYEVVDRETAAVSPPLEFGGGVTALWTEVKGGTAIAVSRNADTGNYEAFRLALACTN